MYDQRPSRISSARIWSRQNVITMVLGTFIILSLLIHAYTIFSLLRVREIVSTQLDISANQVAQLRQQRVEYTLPVQETFPISTTIAINETIPVPINFDVPINQTVRIPINTPLGAVPIDIPLNLTVPISNTVVVPINREIPFQTTIPISTSVPIELALGEGTAGDVLQQLEDSLRELREQLYQ